jgi:hypothetical protein
MTPRSWFGIGVRLLGLWEMLYGLDEVVMMFSLSSGTYHSSVYANAGGVFPFAAFHLIVGGLLLKAAPVLAVWCYPNRAEEPNESGSAANV